MPDPSLQYRFIHAAKADFSAGKDRTLRVCFSSETPVLRADKSGSQFYEVLSHEKQHADLSLLLDGGAFIDEHQMTRQIGSVKRAWLDQDRKCRADLNFADTELGRERWELMSSGNRKDISFGYLITRKLGETFADDGKPIRRFAWKAFEISSVAVGADHFETGVGRNATPQQHTQTHETFMNQQTTEQTEIAALAKSFLETAATTLAPEAEQAVRRLQTKALLEDMPKADFKRGLAEILEKTPRRRTNFAPVDTRTLNHEIGMDPKEIKQYSFARALRNAVENGGRLKNCLEADISEQVENTSGTRSEGFFVPSDVMLGGSRRNYQQNYQQRDLYVGDFASGGAAVNPDMPMPVIELLRNKMICTRLGAMALGGLQGPLNMPRQISPATAQSLGEIATLQDSNLQLDQLILSPKRVGATTTVGKQLIFQSTPDIEGVTRNDILSIIAIKHDLLLICGQGANDEPLGIINTPGVNAVAFGGAASWSKIVDFETELGKRNADGGNLAYATTPSVKGAWKKLAVALTGATTVSSRSLWENGSWGDGSNDGLVNSYRAASTNQIPNNAVIYGNWNELIYATWHGLDMIVDPYTKAKNAEIVITANSWLDGGLRHAQSFTVSSDSGAQ